MPIGDLPNTSSSISFSQIQAAYNEIHETNLSNPISLSEFNGKFLDNSHTAIAISSGNAYALGTLRARHFAVGSYSSSHVIGELTEPGSGTKYLHGQLTGGSNSARIKVSVDNASDTFKVYLQNVVGHGSASLDCRIGLIQVHSGAETVLLSTDDGDTDPEVIQYKPSTGVLHVMSGPTASAGSGNLIADVDDISGWSGSATTFHVVVNGLNSAQTGVFHVYRIPDVAVSSTSNFTFNFFLMDAYGDGWDSAALTIQVTDTNGVYKTINASSLSGVAPAANGGLTLESGAGSASSTAGSLAIPAGNYFITVSAGDFPEEITWSIKDHSNNLVSFTADDTTTPPPGTFTMNVNSSGVGSKV